MCSKIAAMAFLSSSVRAIKKKYFRVAAHQWLLLSATFVPSERLKVIKVENRHFARRGIDFREHGIDQREREREGSIWEE